MAQVKNRPLISVVIANYNYGRFLEEALKSILAQGMDDKIEIIICDAASTDNSVEIIKKYADKISWWCSEKDGGQSEAFNKGFRHARGEWFTWLNADEMYLPGTLKAVADLISRKPQTCWISSNRLEFDDATRKVTYVSWGAHWYFPWMYGCRSNNQILGPSTFFRRDVYEEMGPMDESYHYCLDTEYWERFIMHGLVQTRLNRVCWAFRNHDASKTHGDQGHGVAERRNEERRRKAVKNGYHFKFSPFNIWFDLWLFGLLVDGSLIKRFFVRKKYIGKPVDLFL